MTAIVIPKFLTFTGIDDITDVAFLKTLANKYPVEYGILLSRSRQEFDQRYPSLEKIKVFEDSGIPLSLHICGEYARNILNGNLDIQLGVDLTKYKRIQFNNIENTDTNINNAVEFSNKYKVRVILQTRTMKFPERNDVDWLFDLSGGTGAMSVKWPNYPNKLVGYAGGISRTAILSVIQQLNFYNENLADYYLDMESNIRMYDWFSDYIVEEICRKVYDK